MGGHSFHCKMESLEDLTPSFHRLYLVILPQEQILLTEARFYL